MIEFEGYITGKAEKFFWNNSRKFTIFMFLFPFLVLLPLILFLSIGGQFWDLLIVYIVFFALVFLSFYIIPKSKKEKLKFIPKHIFTDEEYIVCQGNAYEEYNLISDASEVIDYGEFYYINFPFGKKSDKFICQKDLLTKGSIEEFEALFEGKIKRRIKK